MLMARTHTRSVINLKDGQSLHMSTKYDGILWKNIFFAANKYKIFPNFTRPCSSEGAQFR